MNFAQLRSIAALVLLASLCWLAIPNAAHAESRLGLDLDYDAPLKLSKVSQGAGFAIHVGQEAHVPLLVAIPELVFSYDGFPGELGPNIYRGLLGLQIGVGEILRPAIFGHLGVGFLRLDDTRAAFSYDAGLALDLTLLPLIDLGAHIAYNEVIAGDHEAAFRWITLGLHAALVF